MTARVGTQPRNPSRNYARLILIYKKLQKSNPHKFGWVYNTRMNFETITYSTMDLDHSIANEAFTASVGAAPELGTNGGPVSSFAISGFLLWLRLWFEYVSQSRLQDRFKVQFNNIFARGRSVSAKGYQRPPSLLPESARAAFAPRMRANRRARRIMARGIPASRGYAALHHLNGRRLTLGQFMERACKLSTSNRIVVYRLGGRKRLCQCRNGVTWIGHLSAQIKEALSQGLCAAHLWPS